jgi:hypothetical protein
MQRGKIEQGSLTEAGSLAQKKNKISERLPAQSYEGGNTPV